MYTETINAQIIYLYLVSSFINNSFEEKSEVLRLEYNAFQLFQISAIFLPRTSFLQSSDIME